MQQPNKRPSITSIFMEKSEAERKRIADAEAQRIASMTKFDLWFSTLPRHQQKEIDLWEMAHPGHAYPMPNGQAAPIGENGSHRTIRNSTEQMFQPPTTNE